MNEEELKIVALLEKQKRAWKRMAKLSKEIDQARENIKDCSHPKEYLEDYTWTHDNGYGKQSQIIGLHCKICDQSNSWKSMYKENYKYGWHNNRFTDGWD